MKKIDLEDAIKVVIGVGEYYSDLEGITDEEIDLLAHFSATIALTLNKLATVETVDAVEEIKIIINNRNGDINE